MKYKSYRKISLISIDLTFLNKMLVFQIQQYKTVNPQFDFIKRILINLIFKSILAKSKLMFTH